MVDPNTLLLIDLFKTTECHHQRPNKRISILAEEKEEEKRIAHTGRFRRKKARANIID